MQGVINEVFSTVLPILNDDVVERPEEERFDITVTSNSPLISENRLTIVPSQAVVIIADDDGKNHIDKCICSLKLEHVVIPHFSYYMQSM